MHYSELGPVPIWYIWLLAILAATIFGLDYWGKLGENYDPDQDEVAAAQVDMAPHSV